VSGALDVLDHDAPKRVMIVSQAVGRLVLVVGAAPAVLPAHRRGCQVDAVWRVRDLAAGVRELRSRVVEVEEYDAPGLKTVDGIADVGFALPHGSSTRAETRSGSRSSRLRMRIEPEGGRTGPVTTTVTRRVKPGHEPVYEQFLAGIIAAATEFPGHLGVEVFRPETASAGEYRTVYRFDTPEHLRAWLDSDERASWLERAEPHVIGPMHTTFVTGLESWFTLPGRSAAPPPPPYKMALLTWITIFPLITGVVVVVEPLLKGLPLTSRLGITTAVTVPLMTWVVMPRVTRLLRRWLYAER
jgi:antibiotic biosynthesis monooxygenase (ABM) superfamily enzyme